MAASQAEAGPSTLPADGRRSPNDDGEPAADGARPGDEEEEQEPLDDAAIEGMRQRVLDMGVVGDDGGEGKGKGKLQATERESELGRLVLQLCDHAQALSGQLAAQAAHIGHLHDQTAHLVERERDERLRWDAEREGWARTAEVLILQARKGGNSSHRVDDLEKALNIAHRDNKFLRQQLEEVNTQRHILDNQLVYALPAVLMSPAVILEGSRRMIELQHQRMVAQHQHQIAARPPPPPAQSTKGVKRKQSDAQPQPQASTSKGPAQSTSKAAAPAPAQSTSKAAQPQPHRPPPMPPRFVPQPPARRKAPLMPDARHEHLLLAMRKLALPRAQKAYAAGAAAYLQAQPPPVQPSYFLPPAYAPLPHGIVLPPLPDKEKDKDKEKEGGKEPPRTPARKRKEREKDRDVGPPPVTPKVAAPSGSGQQRTPLDSLVSAARMLENGHAQGQNNESPSRKRRKLSSGQHQDTPSRTMSALDVLAAQAVGSSDEDDDELESEEDAPAVGRKVPGSAPRLATLHEAPDQEDEEEEEIDELEDDDDVDVDLSGSLSVSAMDTDDADEDPPEPEQLGRGMRNRVPSVKTRASGSGGAVARGARGRSARASTSTSRAPAPAQQTNGAGPSRLPLPPPAVQESPVAPARIRRMKGQTVWHKR